MAASTTGDTSATAGSTASSGSMGYAMGGAQVVGALAGAYSAYEQGKMAKIGYWLQAQQLRRAKEIALLNADNAIKRGYTEASAVRSKAKALQGSQRVALATNDIDLTQGSPLRILTDTDYMAARDEAQVMDNAQTEAMNYKLQAVGIGSSEAMTTLQGNQINPGMSAASSLLSSAGQVADYWYRNQGNKKT